MARATKTKKKPLRGSVRQSVEQRPDSPPSWFGFGLRLGLLVGGALAVLFVAAFATHSDWPRRQTRAAMDGLLTLTQYAHFAVKDIAVEGRQRTDRDALFEALGIGARDPILKIDVTEARKRLLALPWVEKAEVERRLPDKIFIKLVERQPFARWENDNHIVVIDREGHVLPDADPASFASLPLLAGPGAPEAAEALMKDLNAYPDLAQHMKGALRVGMRRWDLYLLPRLVARLPEKNQKDALEQLDKMAREEKLLERALATVDLRVAGKIALEPIAETPPAAPHKNGDSSP